MPNHAQAISASRFFVGSDTARLSYLGAAALAVAYLALYVFLDWASSMHSLHGLAITPWNPQAGLSLTLLVVHGVRFAPLLAVSALAGDLVIRQSTVPFVAAAVAAFAPALGYSAVAWILNRRIVFDPYLRSVRDVAAVSLAGALGAGAVGLGIIGSYIVFGILAPSNFADAALRHWVGDFIGIVVLTPFLQRLPRIHWFAIRPLEVGAQALLLVAAWALVFEVDFADQFKFFFILFVPVTWITLRYGLTGATFACLAVQVGLMYSTTVTGKDARTVIELQLLMLTLAIASQFTGIVVDERRAEEAARVALRDQLSHMGRVTVSGEIASGVAHELNQPLTAVVNYVHAALMDNRAAKMPEDTCSLLEKAEAQALRAGETLRRLRDFLRRGEMRLSTVSIRDVTADTAALVRHAADQGGIAITPQTMPDSLRVLADRVQLTQILVNLMSNAIDALQSGATADKRIEVGAAASAGGWVELFVADTGPGVPPEHRDHIFDSFFTTKASGMGLGLAISRSLVEAQGGRLWYVPPTAEQPGAFHFTLPAAREEER